MPAVIVGVLCDLYQVRTGALIWLVCSRCRGLRSRQAMT